MGPRLAYEIVKLMLQVAWADHEIETEEIQHVLSFAEKHEISQNDLQLVQDCLAGNEQLPPPDFSLLRAHTEEVLKHVQELIIADDVIAEGENEVLEEVKALLLAD